MPSVVHPTAANLLLGAEAAARHGCMLSQQNLRAAAGPSEGAASGHMHGGPAAWLHCTCPSQRNHAVKLPAGRNACHP